MLVAYNGGYTNKTNAKTNTTLQICVHVNGFHLSTANKM